MKIRITASRGAPIVRNIAMSRVLARTSMISDEMILNEATRMISDRMTNIATRSIDSASNRLAFIDRQSETTALAASLFEALAIERVDRKSTRTNSSH